MAQSFKSAFAAARKELGAGKTFEWGGKKYTTDLASDTTKKADGPTRPKANPKAGGTTATAPGTTRRGGADTRPKKTGGTTTTTPGMTRRGGADTRPKTAAVTPAAATPTVTVKPAAVRQAAGTPFAASPKNPKVTPLGKSTGIGGRLAEAVKSIGAALKGKPAAKPATAFKTPNRADVGKKRK